MRVYNDYNQDCFEGTRQECLDWILDKAFVLSNGDKLYRTWRADGFEFYDVGAVYHIEENA